MSLKVDRESYIPPLEWEQKLLEACRKGEEDEILNLSTRSVAVVSDVGVRTINQALDILEQNEKKDLAKRLVLHISRKNCKGLGDGDLAFVLINNQKYEFAERVLKYGLNPCLSSMGWRGALNAVAEDGKIEWVKRLVEEFKHPVKGVKALFSAVEGGSLEVVRYLLDQGADPSETDGKGLVSPIHIPIISKRLDILELLWERGANMDAGFWNGFGRFRTPQELAGNDEELKKWLKEHPTRKT